MSPHSLLLGVAACALAASVACAAPAAPGAIFDLPNPGVIAGDPAVLRRVDNDLAKREVGAAGAARMPR